MTEKIMQYFEYETIKDWSSEVAEHIALALAADVKKYGKASLALSGGSSPKPFLEKLALYRLPWENIYVTLVDERFVTPEEEGSNEKFIREFFLEHCAGAVQFLPLYRDPDIQKNINILNQNMIMNDLHYSVVVLGMGEDGHTASLFPNSDNLDEGLFDPVNMYSVQTAPVEPKTRISMNLCAIGEARKIFIPINGESKKKTLEKAMQGINKELPISFVLENFSDKITIFGA